MKPRRLVVLGFALLAVTLVALLVLAFPTKYSRGSQRLPDGSSLKLVSISYGTNHSFAMPRRNPWEGFLVAHLPRSWTARLAWTPYSIPAAGVVVEQGGVLSHGSVVARELGLPAVTSATAATRLIRTGDRVQVDGNSGRVMVYR
jgi:hypothetical protein